MTHSYYDPGVERAGKVGDLFDRIAPRYDLVNDLQSFGLHHWWKSRLAALAAPTPGLRLLDLCCGTGDIAFRASKHGAKVVGLDFSEAMLRAARNRQDDHHAPLFIRGDALQLPFPRGTFDVVTMSYGLRNLAAFDRGIGEMVRVAKSGGRILIMDFAKPEAPVWRAFYLFYLRRIVPAIGRIFAGDAAAYAYILESLNHYPSIDGISQIMREQGCQQVFVHQILGGAMSIHEGLTGHAASA